MTGRRLWQDQSEKLAQGKRIGGTPCDRAHGIQAFEVSDQQQPEITPRRQPRPAVIRVESLAQAFDVAIEVVLLKDLIQSRVERLCGTARQVLRRHPCFACLFRLPIAIGDSVVRRIDRVDPDSQSWTGGSPMKLAALLIGIFIIGAGVVGLVAPSPRDVRAFLGEYSATSVGLYVLAAVRIGIGFVFIWAAPLSRTPRALRAIGMIFVALGIVTAFRDVESGRAVIRWELTLPTPLFRVAAAFWVAFGAFVTWTVSKRRTV